MAKYWTWSEIRTKVERDLDLEGESFITADEMLGYANEAIDEVERQIHSLCEDYFLTRGTISLVSGTEEYDLPDDIYAMKIRSLVYRNGTTVFKVEKVKDWHKFEEYELNQTGQVYSPIYGYMIINTTAGSPKVIFAPTPTESGAYIKFWYIRNANDLTDDNSVCDIPEAVNYVIQYIKMRCYEKEGHPNLGKAMGDVEMEKQTTLTTLSSMVVDNSNEIEADMTHYYDMT